MRHTATPTCGGLLARVDAQQSELRARIEELAGTIESKKAANLCLPKSRQRPTLADEARLTRLRDELRECEEHRRRFDDGTAKELTHYQVCRIRAEMEGTVWTDEARALLELPRKAHEGKGEMSVRSMLGLPLVVTQEKRDLDDGDVKWLDYDGHVQTPQVGKCGLQAFLSFVWELPRRKMKDVDPSIIAAIKCGELTKELLEGPTMPFWLLVRLMDYVLPSRVLGQYGNVYAAFEFGYVVIPQADADEAWTLINVTKGKPRYGLNKRYSLRKMLEASNVAPVAA